MEREEKNVRREKGEGEKKNEGNVFGFWKS